MASGFSPSDFNTLATLMDLPATPSRVSNARFTASTVTCRNTMFRWSAGVVARQGILRVDHANLIGTVTQDLAGSHKCVCSRTWKIRHSGKDVSPHTILSKNPFGNRPASAFSFAHSLCGDHW